MNKWKQSNEHRKKKNGHGKKFEEREGYCPKNVRFSKLVRTTCYKVMVLCMYLHMKII